MNIGLFIFIRIEVLKFLFLKVSVMESFFIMIVNMGIDKLGLDFSF